MEARYTRNRIYLTEKEQETIKHCPILLAGSGIGSVIAECALRLGFENMTIIDGDLVELSNLNRQNYTESDVCLKKAEAIRNRLININGSAKITVFDNFLTSDNLFEHIDGHQIAINALDFTSEVPLEFDRLCQNKGLHVLHPYNLGWGGLVTVIAPNGTSMDTLKKPGSRFNELNFVEYVSGYMKFWGDPHSWIDNVVHEYITEESELPPPQLSIGAWTVASMCSHVLFLISTGKTIKKFPDFYFSTIMESK